MEPIRIKSITEFHRWRGLPKPEHPLISVVDYSDIKFLPLEGNSLNIMFDFYSIALKRDGQGKLNYGQQIYDFDEGVMFFTAPNQILRINKENKITNEQSGWILFIHPDFLWNTILGSLIKKFEFFDYAVNEALFLSDREEAIMHNIVKNVKHEYHSNIDNFSQDIIISQLQTLLNYSERFYNRQFLTRKKEGHLLLNKLEQFLNDYFNDKDLSQGLPTVDDVAKSLNYSSSYLRSLLKVLTGKNTQQHIHDKLIEKAKEKLSTTNLSISEVAYELGFEHPQSFSKLFKLKTNQSPVEFKQMFN